MTYITKPFIPMTNKEHAVENCESPMACSICMSRCYEDKGGHLFDKGGDQPCNCGTYKSLKEWSIKNDQAH